MSSGAKHRGSRLQVERQSWVRGPERRTKAVRAGMVWTSQWRLLLMQGAALIVLMWTTLMRRGTLALLLAAKTLREWMMMELPLEAMTHLTPLQCLNSRRCQPIVNPPHHPSS
uniref:Uncharacterized protein n=1 Tax=Hemiselmis andersenii TaxID=464988 RepID=A0A7S1EG83_HEMAN|mmetsp:Transcript_47095/g.114461  ORF Transcript_47095/g.114461 Transcript_47095/m.114461 type:complete len:113 (+) Transcript_47095:77-415(+)